MINGDIKLEYINTTEQLDDGLTKALTPDHHLQGVRGLLTSYQMSKTILYDSDILCYVFNLIYLSTY